MRSIYSIFLQIGIVGSLFVFPRYAAAEDIRCYSYGCVIPHEDKLFLPIWDLWGLNTFLDSIENLPIVHKAEKLTKEIATIDTILSHSIDYESRKSLEGVRGYILAKFRTILWEIKQKKFPKPTFDLTGNILLRLQKYHLSCEIKATVLALKYLGVSVTEDEFITKLPFDTSASEYKNGVWWDPDMGFVWSIHGNQRQLTGYGVYERPLAIVATRYNITSEIINEWHYSSKKLTPKKHLTYLIDQLEKWKMVVLWWDWCTDPRYEDGVTYAITDGIILDSGIAGKNTCSTWGKNRDIYWVSSTGKIIYWLVGEHAFTLLGYIGPKKTPSHIIVWDTDTGRHVYPTSEWMRKWKALSYRSLILSKKK